MCRTAYCMYCNAYILTHLHAARLGGQRAVHHAAAHGGKSLDLRLDVEDVAPGKRHHAVARLQRGAHTRVHPT